ncbi:hypothetical protein BJY01DRAFT_20364 [Aspergillus pseudoustus]|uniref:Uncharacterized protein n=1 Tax=Aspergillus pseudoustus TaxID=1810923 RepID=A0ABR4JKG6_9EURO
MTRGRQKSKDARVWLVGDAKAHCAISSAITPSAALLMEETVDLHTLVLLFLAFSPASSQSEASRGLILRKFSRRCAPGQPVEGPRNSHHRHGIGPEEPNNASESQTSSKKERYHRGQFVQHSRSQDPQLHSKSGSIAARYQDQGTLERDELVLKLEERYATSEMKDLIYGRMSPLQPYPVRRRRDRQPGVR